MTIWARWGILHTNCYHSEWILIIIMDKDKKTTTIVYFILYFRSYNYNWEDLKKIIKLCSIFGKIQWFQGSSRRLYGKIQAAIVYDDAAYNLFMELRKKTGMVDNMETSMHIVCTRDKRKGAHVHMWCISLQIVEEVFFDCLGHVLCGEGIRLRAHGVKALRVSLG
jgi:hypothetical protein